MNCVRCGQQRPIKARRLCTRCYPQVRVEGKLDDYPLSIRPGEELVEDYRFLAGQGLSKRQAAERLGVKLTALRRAVQRHREAA